MSESSESETVGYKQPPRKTQFKPGKSGNPRGRPKRKVNMSESLNRVLDDKIVVTGLGKGKTGLEAFVQSIVDRVLQGDAKGIPALMRLFSKTTLFKPAPRPRQSAALPPGARGADRGAGPRPGPPRARRVGLARHGEAAHRRGCW